MLKQLAHDRPLPHSDEAEMAVLGAILISPEALSIARSRLRAEDFHRDAHRAVFRAAEALEARGVAIDPVTICEELRDTGQLKTAGGQAQVAKLCDGVPRSSNVDHYAAIVAEKSRRRRGIEAAYRFAAAAYDGVPEEELTGYVRDLVEVAEERPRRLLVPSPLDGVLRPDAWKVQYLVDRLIPSGEFVLNAAEWKTGKTLLAYRLALDLASGRKVFDVFDVAGPARIGIFQWDMPHIGESCRRLSKLAVGSGLTPQDVARLAKEGCLTLYNRPPLNLAAPADVASFLATVRDRGLALVIVDSVGVAFAGEDQNDNSTVRKLVSSALAPLTTEGTVVLGLHHKRKKQPGSKDYDKAAVLGSQAWGAAAGRIYSLERIDDAGSPGKAQQTDAANSQVADRRAAAGPRRAFLVRLSLTGSWTPEDSPDVVLAVEDTEDGEGTTVRVLDEGAQIAVGGLSTAQRVGIALANLVKARGRVSRRDAFAIVGAELRVAETSLKQGQGYAEAKWWIVAVPSESGRNNEKDFIPGGTLEEPW